MKRIQKIQHNGRDIVRFDFQGLTEDDEIISYIKEIEDYLLALESPTLQLNNITGVYFTPQVMNELTAAGKRWEHTVLKDAIVGVVGVKRILLRAYNAIVGGKAKAFSTEEEALEWLAG